MLKPTLLISVVLLAAAASAVNVEGVTPVTIGKKGSAYPVSCGTPLKLTASGPGSMVVDIRGKADAMGKPLELDFTRNDKAVSKNNLTLKKKKDAGKGFAGMATVVLVLPEGEQHYSVSCDGPGEIALSFKMTKKAASTNLAAPEVPAETPKPTAAKGADGGAPDGGAQATAGADGGAAPPAAAAGGDSNQAYPGLFTHIGL
jgi:hypothetical protein